MWLILTVASAHTGKPACVGSNQCDKKGEVRNNAVPWLFPMRFVAVVAVVSVVSVVLPRELVHKRGEYRGDDSNPSNGLLIMH